MSLTTTLDPRARSRPWLPTWAHATMPFLPPIRDVAEQIAVPTETPIVAAPPRKGRLHFTIGAQRSGKTTYARQWVRLEPADGFPRAMWDSDDLRLALHDQRYCRPAEPMVFAIKQLAIKALLANHDLIVAGTHSSKASIRRLLEIDRGAVPILIDTPLAVCLERAVRDGQEDLLGVIPAVVERVQAIKRRGAAQFVLDVLADMDAHSPY